LQSKIKRFQTNKTLVKNITHKAWWSLLLVISVISCGPKNNIAKSTVYITKTGEFYHLGECTYSGRSKIPKTLYNVVQKGYRPCSKCAPPVLFDSLRIINQDYRYYAPENTERANQTDSSNKNDVKRRCIAITRKGTQCKRITKRLSNKCFQHDK